MGKVVELRVEDDPEPLQELKRNLRLKRAYDWVEKGDDLLGLGRIEESLGAFKKAEELAPDYEEIRFWVGVTLSGSQTTQREGIEIVKEILSRSPNWKTVTKSLVVKGYLPKDNPIGDLL